MVNFDWTKEGEERASDMRIAISISEMGTNDINVIREKLFFNNKKTEGRIKELIDLKLLKKQGNMYVITEDVEDQAKNIKQRNDKKLPIQEVGKRQYIKNAIIISKLKTLDIDKIREKLFFKNSDAKKTIDSLIKKNLLKKTKGKYDLTDIGKKEKDTFDFYKDKSV